jgi:hypothetical protein
MVCWIVLVALMSSELASVSIVAADCQPFHGSIPKLSLYGIGLLALVGVIAGAHGSPPEERRSALLLVCWWLIMGSALLVLAGVAIVLREAIAYRGDPAPGLYVTLIMTWPTLPVVISAVAFISPRALRATGSRAGVAALLIGLVLLCALVSLTSIAFGAVCG